MLHFIVFTFLTLSTFYMGITMGTKQRCLSLMTQYQVERDLNFKNYKFTSLKIGRIFANHLLTCKSPIAHGSKTQSFNLKNQNIQIEIEGKINDFK